MPTNKKKKPEICRIASLAGFDNVLMGRDFADIFEPGHVYEVRKIMGEVVFTDLGEHATDKFTRGATIGLLATSGIHLLTKAEYQAQIKAQKDDYGN